MAPNPPTTSRRTSRLLAMTSALLIVGALVFSAGALVDRRIRTLDGKQREINNLALVLAGHTERVFEAADLVFRTTIAEMASNPPLGGKPRAAVEAVLRARISGTPAIRSVTIVGRDGVISASSIPNVTGNLAKAPSFAFMRDDAEDGMYIWRTSSYPVSGTFIPITRRMVTVDGKFAGFVNISLEPEYFQSLYRNIALDPQSAVLLVRNDRETLASFPNELTPPPFSVGGPMIKPLKDHAMEVKHEEGALDYGGVPQQFARSYLTRYPLHVEVRATDWVTLASWRTQSVVIGTAVIAFSMLGLFLVWRMYKEIGLRAVAERKAAAQVRLSQAVFDTVPHPIFVKDGEGRYLEVNRAMADYWRMTPEQMKGQPIVAPAGRDPTEIDANAAEDQLVLSQGREIASTRPTVFPDGQMRQFHVIRRPLRDEAGRIVGLVGTAVDETERLDAEAQSRETRQLLETIFDTIPHHIWMKDKDGRIVHANLAMEKYYGRSVVALRGQRIAGEDFRSKAEIARFVAEDRRVLVDGQNLEVTQWAKGPDGQNRQFHIVKRPLRDAQGTITGLVAISMDVTELRRTEAALHDSQVQLAAIVDTVPHHIWMKDKEGKMLRTNRSLQQYIGATGEELAGQRIVGAHYRTAEENARIAEEDRRVLQLGETLEESQWASSPDGKQRRFHVVKRPLRDSAGSIAGLVAISMDITALTQTEEQLKQSQALLQTVFDAVPLVVLVRDLEHRLIAVNREGEKWWGTPASKMLGHTMVDLGMAPDQYRNVWESDTQVTREDRIVDYDLDMTMPSGETRRFRTIKAPLHGTDGKVTGVLSVSEDITEHARATEALHESQALLKTVFDNIPLSLLVKDLDDRLLMVNPLTAARWNLPPEQLVGKRVKDLPVPPDERAVVESTDAQVVRENRILDYELERTMPDGQARRLRAIKAPLHGKDGKVTGILGISEDITERTRVQREKMDLERQLEQVQKMDTVGRLAGGVAHDFNNLLTPVIGFVDLALHRVPASDRLRQDLTMIRESAARAAELTRGLLSFSRSQVMTLRAVNLNDEIRSLNRMVSRVIGEGIEIVLALDPALDLVHADTTQMHQVLMNLAVNGRDAMPNGGKLVIESRNIDLDPGYAERILEITPGKYVMISVTDTGIGMSPEVQKRIFEPFFTTKEVGKGTGLGLSIVYGIVRQHHGTIRVYSEVAQGTSFKLLFPQHAPGGEVAAPVQRTLDELRGSERILVVEDESRVRDAICALLGSLGYKVVQAASPQDAFSLVDNGGAGAVELLISDMMLPGQNGREMYSKLRQRLPHLNVLYMSGYPRDVLADSSAAVGPDRFIGKPFGLHDLAEKVRVILAAGAPA